MQDMCTEADGYFQLIINQLGSDMASLNCTLNPFVYTSQSAQLCAAFSYTITREIFGISLDNFQLKNRREI